MAGYPSSFASAGSQARLISPPIVLGSTITSCTLKFYLLGDPGYPWAPDSLKIETSTNCTTFTRVAAFNRYAPSQGWVEHTIFLGNLSGTIYIGFLAHSGYGHNMYIDYVRLVGVPHVPQIDIGIDTIISPGATHRVNTPMSIIGRLRRYSGGGPTQNFPTICSIVGANGALRYTNTQTVIWPEPLDTVRVSFASWTPTLGELCTVKLRILYPDSNPANNRKTRTTLIYWGFVYEGFEEPVFPPSGWQNIILTGTYNWQRFTAGTSPTCTPYEGAAMTGFPSFSASVGSQARLITVPCYAGYTPRPCSMNFFMYHDDHYPGGTLGPDSVKVEISTDGINFTRVANFRRYEPVNGWVEHVVYLGTLSGSYYIGFLAFSEYGNNMYIDCVRTIRVRVEENIANGHFITRLNPLKPNPVMSGFTRISFSLAEPSQTTLKIFDASGRLVKILVDEFKSSGVYSVSWNCRDGHSRQVPEGVYFYTLQTGNYNSTKKLILAK